MKRINQTEQDDDLAECLRVEEQLRKIHEIACELAEIEKDNPNLMVGCLINEIKKLSALANSRFH